MYSTLILMVSASIRSKSSQCTHLLRVHRSYCVSVETREVYFDSSLIVWRLIGVVALWTINHQTAVPVHDRELYSTYGRGRSNISEIKLS